ncbi:MAG: helix-turn-helix transcriptional regulator [Puniceicoccales bacterium]|jgi:DNA-binding HxlR family transcriptional regulator|nr:helix-turn-helix transcriptional regulator [Puniceicoccales bacterium]
MNSKFSPDKSGPPDAKRCFVRDVLVRVGDRWSLLALVTLADDTLRFTQLKHAIGDISQRMLAQTLRVLERDGYVSRKVYPTTPPMVEYGLTVLGKSFLARAEPLIAWAMANRSQILEARKAYKAPPANKAL